MKTITLNPPTCALCKKTLVGEAVELDSGKLLHPVCVEDAVELGLRAGLTLTKWEEPEKSPSIPSVAMDWYEEGLRTRVSAPETVERIALNGRNPGPEPEREMETEPEPVKPPYQPQPMRPRGSVKEAVEKVVASVVETQEPEPVKSPTVTQSAAEWLTKALSGGERWTAELMEEGKAAGFSVATLRAASTAIGAENRSITTGGRQCFLKRLPGDTRLIGETPAEPTPNAEPAAPEPEPAPVAVPPEPLTPESYVCRRDALGMTDTTIAYWVPAVSARTLRDYADKMSMPTGCVKSVEALLAKLEAANEETRNRYRYPTGDEDDRTQLRDRVFARLA